MTPDVSGDRPIMPLDVQPDPNDAAVSLLRKILADAFWRIVYHEAELTNAHRKVAVVSAFLERAGMPIDLKDARKVYDAMEDPDEPRDVHEFAAALLVEAENGIEHHETNLADSHTTLAHAKALMQRAKLNLSLADIEATARARLNHAA
jgi:hypothetical protein